MRRPQTVPITKSTLCSGKAKDCGRSFLSFQPCYADTRKMISLGALGS